MNQNAGRLIRQVARTGEPIVVTDRGTPIARLVPIGDAPPSTLDQLRAEGRVRPATKAVADAAVFAWTAPGDPLSVLAELRGDR